MDGNGRALPAQMADRLIVALDVEDVPQARVLVTVLGDAVRFYKIGLWLFFKPGVDALIDELVQSGKRVFLDYKMYDIGETVRRGVAAAAARGVSFVTVHGDSAIMQAAAEGARGTALQVLAVTVLTSLGDAGAAELGYAGTARDLVARRVRAAAACGVAGVIASAVDGPDALRREAGAEGLLVVTPGIRMADDLVDEHARSGTPAGAIRDGADYLVVGRPILRAEDPRARAEQIVAEMERGAALRAG